MLGKSDFPRLYFSWFKIELFNRFWGSQTSPELRSNYSIGFGEVRLPQNFLSLQVFSIQFYILTLQKSENTLPYYLRCLNIKLVRISVPRAGVEPACRKRPRPSTVCVYQFHHLGITVYKYILKPILFSNNNHPIFRVIFII